MTLSRLSLAILSVLAGAPAFADDSGVDLDQGWNQTQKTAWLEAGQGSRMLPLAWLVALEQRASEEPLMSDALIRQYGYVPHTLGGSSVKVVQGYAVDRSDDSDLTFTKLRWKALQGSREPWVGPTCSMCHTSHISYQGTQLTVYGGQTMGDLAGFRWRSSAPCRAPAPTPPSSSASPARCSAPTAWSAATTTPTRRACRQP